MPVKHFKLNPERHITLRHIKCCASLVSLVRAGVTSLFHVNWVFHSLWSRHCQCTPKSPSFLFVNLNICHFQARLPTCPFLLPLPRPVINILHMIISTHTLQHLKRWPINNICVWGVPKPKGVSLISRPLLSGSEVITGECPCSRVPHLSFSLQSGVFSFYDRHESDPPGELVICKHS